MFVGNRFGAETGVSRWTFDGSFNATHNGTFETPGPVADLRFVPTALEVVIDIEPGSDPAGIRAGSDGMVRVAIMSSADLDATIVDPLSVMLASSLIGVPPQPTDRSMQGHHGRSTYRSGRPGRHPSIITVNVTKLLARMGAVYAGRYRI